MSRCAFVWVWVALLAGACTSFVPGDAGRGEVSIARDGKALAQIVVSAKPTAVARFAAAELKWHLDRMTGADFPLVSDSSASTGMVSILVGPTSMSRLDIGSFSRQEYAIDVRPGAIELAGIDDPAASEADIVHLSDGAVENESAMPRPYARCSTTYAVYAFLEDMLGVKWLDPTDYGTYVPERKTVTLPFSRRREVPFFRSRSGSFRNAGDLSFWKRSGGAPSEREGFDRYVSFAYHGRDARARAARMRLFCLRRRAFGEKSHASHSFYDWYARFWEKSPSSGIPFVARRPGYFSAPAGRGIRPSQLCYTNPDVIRQVVADARAYFDGPAENRRWGDDCISLEPMDNADFCRCSRCSALYEPEKARSGSGHSAYWFGFVNKVARELAESHPGKRVNTLAYMTHEGVPCGMRLEKNVTVHFCLFNNRMTYDSAAYGRRMDRLARWAREYPENRFAVWMYNTFPLENYNYAGVAGVPGFFSRHAQGQYAALRDLGVSDGIYHCGMNGTIDSYLQFRWMLDPSLEAEDLLDRFFSAYGPAAEPLREFYDIVESRYSDPDLRPRGMSRSSLECCWRYVCPPPVMEKLASLVRKAENAVARGTDFEKARVKLFRLEVWEYMLAGSRQFALSDCAYEPLWESRRVPDAGGDTDGVDWSSVRAVRSKMFYGGGELASPVETVLRFANDSTHLYVEAETRLKTSRLRDYVHVAYCDDLEFHFARGRAGDCRVFFFSPGGALRAADFSPGKRGVPPPAGQRPAFGVKYSSDTSRGDVWLSRIAFPLDAVAGETARGAKELSLNVFSVLDPVHVGRVGSHTVLASTPYSDRYDTRRTGKVALK